MAPKKKTARAAANKKGTKVRRPRRPRAMGLDAGAIAHRRLLLDPCNAALSGPAYSGMGSGQFRRYRKVIVAEGSSVEGCYVFQPGTNTFWKGSHVAATAGTNYTFNGVAIFDDGAIFNGLTNIRCVAGCVKVRYIGAESDRAGVVGLLASPAAYWAPGNTSSASNDLTCTPVVNRVGEVQHEVKFVPGGGDEEFTVGSQPGTIRGPPSDRGTMVVAYRAVPAQTIQFEITVVLEIEQANVEGGVVTAVPPVSNFTLNQLLRSLGPVSSWAYGHVIAPTIRAAAGAAYNTFASSVGAAVRGTALLTL